MDEKKLNDEELEAVSGGKPSSAFAAFFAEKNCNTCSKYPSNCPYGGIQGRYDAFGGNADAVCPEKEARQF